MKTIIFDYFLLEGVMAYFKVCIVIFGLVEDTLLKVSDLGEFFGFFDKYLAAYTDYVGFKTAYDSVFLNKELLGKARLTLIAKEMAIYQRTFNHGASEKCNENSPYCFVKREEVFSEYVNYIVKDYNIVDNLKSAYFSPYNTDKGNPLTNVDDLDSTDKDKVESLTDLALLRSTIEDSTPVYTTGNMVVSPKPLLLTANIDRRVLCVRTTHTCEFKVLDQQKQEYLNILRTNFYNVSNRQYEEYIGPFIANLYSRKKSRFAIKLSKIHLTDVATRANINYRIKRTSFEIRKRPKFLSVDGPSTTTLTRVDKDTFLNIFKSKRDKDIVVKNKGTSKQEFKLNIVDDELADKSDEEILSKLNTKYRTSIINSFMIDE